VSDAPLLTLEMLTRLEGQWRAQGAPIVDRLRPGLTREEIHAVARPLGLTLPREARLWWQWHDGADSPDGLKVSVELGPLGYEYRPLRDLVETLTWARAFAAESAADPRMPPEAAQARYWWNDAWFPLFAGLGIVACDCSVSDGDPTPIRVVIWEDGPPFDDVKARSFGELITWWIEALEDGSWRYDPRSQQWERDHARISSSRRGTGLV
jgi:cell wall assembly regulator SMI1